MGCLFTCFRIRDGDNNNKRHHRKTTATSTTTTTAAAAVPSRHNKRNQDDVQSRNQLSTLFLSEEGEDNVRHNGRNLDEGSQRDNMELKDEAKFLKACGTIAGTPGEIRKATEKLKVSPSSNKDPGPPEFRSWLLDTSTQNVPIDVQPFNPPTPKKHCEEWEKGTDCSDHTPSSCISNAHNNTQWEYHDSAEGSGQGSYHPTDGSEMSRGRNKSVRFDCDTDVSSCESSAYSGWHMKRSESPNPTPMKISEVMQTPGTVYPANLKDLPNGKLVKSQFVYPNSSLSEDVSKSMILEEDDSVQDSRKLSESTEQSQNATSTPDKNEAIMEESLSSWLKPASVILEERRKKMEMGYYQVRKTPADRPIIGMVAAHWNEEENSDVPPKWWDGNGIPNSTNKYKEDQKVSWHATPFEERLEKALSEDTVITRRKDICGKPIAFDENEESDTALSQLKPSTHTQSVVSF
ncbi:protein JASON isoform X1 [Trifolium pratense]|uniref:protein JASON isoform X1 n=1 Tax=Trifolium pratense TaxID=57577 RepID=UPI001E694AC0|nr:protein JASON isoform X1 [Trifolium pratense]